MSSEPYTPVSPRGDFEDASFEALYTPIGYSSPKISFETLSNSYIRSQHHVTGLRAVVPGFNGDASSAYMVATAQRNKSVNAYFNAQVRMMSTSQTTESVRFDEDAKTTPVPTFAHTAALSPAARPKSALHRHSATASELYEKEGDDYRHVHHAEQKREHKARHRQNSEVGAQHKTVRQATVERILARSESDAYRSYCTRSVKGLRLTSSPAKPVRIQDPAPEPEPYQPVMRSRTQRRQDEREEEERKKEAARSHDPIRRNPDGTPRYAVVSQHKELFDKALERDRKQVEDYEEHVKRIRQDRSSLLVIKGADGKEYKYNERGFKVVVTEYVKPRVQTPPKVEHHGPYFRGEIIHKTQSHVENMRRMIKLRHEQARWDSHSLPWTTFSTVQEAHVSVYAPKNAVPGSAFHREVLKYGNTHANSNSKFGVGNSGKKFIGAQDSKVFAQGDIDLLPLVYFRSWPEYESLEPNDVTITIEHCHSCHKHQFKTRHVESKYLNLAREYRQIMIRVCAQFACRLSIIMKPIVDHDPLLDWNFHHPMDYSPILNGNPGKSGGDKNSFTRVDVMEKIQFETNTNRCGAFEIQVALKQASGRVVKHILFSKLFYGAWPCRPDVATLMDALMSANMIRLPEELPLRMFNDKLSDHNLSKDILDTRELTDPTYFARMKKQEAHDKAIATLLEAQKIELEECSTKRKQLDADMAAAEKRAANADAKLVSVRLQNAETLKISKLKARKAAEIQHRAWGATLDEDAWELEYAEMVSKNPNPLVVSEEDFKQTFNRETESVNIARVSVDSVAKAMSALLEKHQVQLHRLKGGHEDESVVTQESTPLQELDNAQVSAPSVDAKTEAESDNAQVTAPSVDAKTEAESDNAQVTAPLVDAKTEAELNGCRVTALLVDANAEAEPASSTADIKQVSSNSAGVRADLKVELEAVLHQEMQDKLEAAILEGKREAAALRLELQTRIEKERVQREALEADLKAIRDKAMYLEKQIAEVAAKRQGEENLAVAEDSSRIRTDGPDKCEDTGEDTGDDVGSDVGSAVGTVVGTAIGGIIGASAGKFVGPAVGSAVESVVERVTEYPEEEVPAHADQKLALDDALTKLVKKEVLNLVSDAVSLDQSDKAHVDIDAILEVGTDLNLAALEQQSPAFPKLDEHEFEHDESFWDTDSKDAMHEVTDNDSARNKASGELYANDDFDFDSQVHSRASANETENLLFDD